VSRRVMVARSSRCRGNSRQRLEGSNLGKKLRKGGAKPLESLTRANLCAMPWIAWLLV
jgi:hypothetical protein